MGCALPCVASGREPSSAHGWEAAFGARARRALKFHFAWAIGAVVARFAHTEEVTGSNPVSPTPVQDRGPHLPILLLAAGLCPLPGGKPAKDRLWAKESLPQSLFVLRYSALCPRMWDRRSVVWN